MRIFPKKRRGALALSAVTLVALPLFFWAGARHIQNGANGQSLDALADSLRRAAVHCYAVEGRYPPDLDYLCSEYRVYYDDSRYLVHYTLEASNLVPDITIVALGEGVVE